MRTSLSIDDDILVVARAMAKEQRRSVGSVISDLARESLRRPRATRERNGIPLLDARSGSAPITLELVNALRDELP